MGKRKRIEELEDKVTSLQYQVAYLEEVVFAERTGKSLPPPNSLDTPFQEKFYAIRYGGTD